MEIRSAYDDHDRVKKEFPHEGQTQQHMADDCDVNKIMERYEKTGLLDHVNEFQGNYGDFTDVQDYQTSVNQVIAANEVFMSLPAQIRAQFENNPGAFFEFVSDDENLPAMKEMGLIPPGPPEKEPDPAPKPKVAEKAPEKAPEEPPAQ